MFLNLGFKSVTMDDLAKEMGISKKTIYTHFENKEELVDVCTLSTQDTIDAMISEIVQKGLNAIEENFAIKNVFEDMFKKAETSPMFQLKKYYPKTYEKLMQREVCTFSDCIATNIDKGIKEKLYRENIDKEMVVKFYFILAFGVYDNEMFSRRMADILKTEITVLEYHTRAIATSKGIGILERELVKHKQ